MGRTDLETPWEQLDKLDALKALTQAALATAV
jgi:S-adenosylmethionine synthetase